MIKAIFAGSFDPPTYGHLDIVSRALSFCDEIYMSIGLNSQKKSLFNDGEKLWLLSQSIVEGLGPVLAQRIYPSTYDGLLVDFATKNGVSLLIRGARTSADYEYEHSLALINKKLAPNVETIILPANTELGIVSSSMVRELSKFGKDCKEFVTPIVSEYLKEKFVKSEPHV